MDRFELRFSNENILGTDTFDAETSDIQFYFANNNQTIVIENPKLKNIRSVELFNILGQSILRHNKIGTQKYTELKTSSISAGSYILEIETTTGKTSKKVLIE